MTAVVGILNKRGVAIAADSAVTRTRYDKAKVTKNGNKMIRMSNAVPISVMITGNAAFMGNPWGVVVRCYRRDRGDISHPTVEACARDLFDYMVSNEQLWSAKYTEMLIADILQSIFSEVEELVAPSVCERCLESRDYTLSKSYLGNFLKRLKKFRDAELAKGVCPQFEGYTIESFRTIAQPILQKWIAEKSDESKIELPYPEQFLSKISDLLEQLLFAKLTTRVGMSGGVGRLPFSVLVFTGYGAEQEYPSLIPVCVSVGIDNRINYNILEDDVVCISDENPVAICPFAQSDISRAIISGLHGSYYGKIDRLLKKSFSISDSVLFGNDDELDFEFKAMLSDVRVDDLRKNIFKKAVDRQKSKNQRLWEKQLENYDLKAMAALAESLIGLTGFHRILTFCQEGVGGTLDVAVITKNDGFSWLSRKSWYHNKDVNGQYGKLGI